MQKILVYVIVLTTLTAALSACSVFKKEEPSAAVIEDVIPPYQEIPYVEVPAGEDPPIKLFVNTTQIPLNEDTGIPFVDELGNLMVPVRAISEPLGLKVDWSEPAQTVKLSNGRNEVSYVIGENEYKLGDGKTIAMQAKAVILEKRTYVPVYSSMSALDGTSDWYPTTREAYIFSSPAMHDKYKNTIPKIIGDFTVKESYGNIGFQLQADAEERYKTNKTNALFFANIAPSDRDNANYTLGVNALRGILRQNLSERTVDDVTAYMRGAGVGKELALKTFTDNKYNVTVKSSTGSNAYITVNVYAN
ncbi:hypothetical protein AGMMS49975_01830 [Clostridia bacterium]|nr:hypothetical protein AGMMS49975_01830 [Clostridia bacterium]